MSGTPQAAPHVAGLAALVLALNGGLGTAADRAPPAVMTSSGRVASTPASPVIHGLRVWVE